MPYNPRATRQKKKDMSGSGASAQDLQSSLLIAQHWGHADDAASSSRHGPDRPRRDRAGQLYILFLIMVAHGNPYHNDMNHNHNAGYPYHYPCQLSDRGHFGSTRGCFGSIRSRVGSSPNGQSSRGLELSHIINERLNTYD